MRQQRRGGFSPPESAIEAIGREKPSLTLLSQLFFNRHLARAGQQRLQRLSLVFRPHQLFADQDGVESGGAQTIDVFARLDAAFAHERDLPWEFGREIERGLKRSFKRAQVAV